jgi:cytidyltransferase-like protein
MTQSRKPVRVYADMCGDLFHEGHVNLLRQARALGDELLAGVMSDADMAAYKRPPVLTMAERIAVIAACRYVDRVVPNAPTRPTPEFLRELGVDIVCHGDDYTPDQVRDYYGAILATHKLVLVPYTASISTSTIVARIRSRSDL